MWVPFTRTGAQDFPTMLSQARSSYQSGDLEDARFALQEALNEINRVIGNEILGMLPGEMKGMDAVEDGDQITGTAGGFAGLYVSREYSDSTRTASVEIISDSPMLAGINSILTMPAFAASDPNQKRIRVGSYKALMTKDLTENDEVSYTVQVPAANLLLTFRTSGIADETEVIELANSLPMDGITKIAR